MKHPREGWRLPGTTAKPTAPVLPILSDRTKLLIGAVMFSLAAAAFVLAYIFSLG